MSLNAPATYLMATCVLEQREEQQEQNQAWPPLSSLNHKPSEQVVGETGLSFGTPAKPA